MSRSVAAPAARLLAGAALACASATAGAQGLFDVEEPASRVGSGALSLGFHTSRGEGTFTDSGEVFAAGDVDTRALILGLDYRLAERWSLSAHLPFVRRRNQGFLSHNPALLRPPRPGLPVVDDGDWHGGLQDLSLVVHYDWIDDAMRLRPFLGLSVPLRDYPFFGNSAIGTRLVKGRVGIEAVRPIGLSDFYWRAQYAYEIIERSYEGVSTNAHLGELELGWFAARGLRLRAFVTERDGKGLGGNVDYGRRTNERWYFHDRNVRHGATVAGLGAEYAFAPDWSASLVALRLLEGRAIHNIRFASTLEIAWHFD